MALMIRLAEGVLIEELIACWWKSDVSMSPLRLMLFVIDEMLPFWKDRWPCMSSPGSRLEPACRLSRLRRLNSLNRVVFRVNDV